MSNPSKFVFKITIAGPGGVGKTSAVSWFVDGKFNAKMQPTLGVDFSFKNIKLSLDSNADIETQITLQIWDVAGESKFRTLIPHYIKNTNGIIYTFDCTNINTLLELNEWVSAINQYLGKKVTTLLMSTKHDLKSRIDDTILHKFMQENDIKYYYPTSSVNGDNINTAFVQIATIIALEHELKN